MTMNLNLPTKAFTLLLCLLPFQLSNCSNTDTNKIENLAAFARTYGLVRWFYPSDEAQEIDWNRFALYGSCQVAGCRSTDELKTKLETLFKLIAPGISFSAENTPPDNSLITPQDTTGMYVIAW